LVSAQLTMEQLKERNERARIPMPKFSFEAFQGAHEADVPERVGIPNPTTKVVLECSGTSCALTMGEMRQSYPYPGATVQTGLFERTRISVAERFAGAQLRGCINLAGDAMPDGPFACKIEGMPGGKHAVLIVPPGPPGEE